MVETGRRLTNEENALAMARHLRDALSAAGEAGSYVGADVDDVLIDGTFNLVRAAHAFLAIAAGELSK